MTQESPEVVAIAETHCARRILECLMQSPHSMPHDCRSVQVYYKSTSVYHSVKPGVRAQEVLSSYADAHRLCGLYEQNGPWLHSGFSSSVDAVGKGSGGPTGSSRQLARRELLRGKQDDL